MLQRGQLFRIQRVDAGKKPILYVLEDLLGEKVKGYFYISQLVQSPEPKQGQFFKVQQILKKRKVNGKQEYLVKFLHYPNKFNEWIKEEDLLEKEDGST